MSYDVYGTSYNWLVGPHAVYEINVIEIGISTRSVPDILVAYDYPETIYYHDQVLVGISYDHISRFDEYEDGCMFTISVHLRLNPTYNRASRDLLPKRIKDFLDTKWDDETAEEASRKDCIGDGWVDIDPAEAEKIIERLLLGGFTVGD